jgi:ribosomal protein S18 acetylase RimI-like enzyme
MLNAKTIERILEDNFYEKVTFLPKLCDSMKIQDNDAISFIDAGVSSDTFNVACLRNKEKLSENEAKNMVNYYTEKNVPFALWVGPQNFDEEVEKILQFANLKCVETELAMAVDSQNAVMKFSEVDGFVVKEVSGIDEFKDYGFVMASVFDPFDEEAIAFYEKISANYDCNNGTYRMFVGYMNNEPAAICCSIISDKKFGGIYDIVTNPKFQRKGLGTHMTSVAIKNLIDVGCDVVGMQASDDGQHVYKKMGFESFGTFRVYSV